MNNCLTETSLALKAGFPQGPLHVYGTAGGGVIYHGGLFRKSRRPDLLPIPETLIKMYEAGYTGVGKACSYKDGLEPDKSALEFVVRNTSLPIPERDEAKEMLLLAMVNHSLPFCNGFSPLICPDECHPHPSIISNLSCHPCLGGDGITKKGWGLEAAGKKVH